MNRKLVAPAVILLVEDNPGDAELAKEAIENSKIMNELYIVNDGVKALEFLRKEGEYKDVPIPDIILLDLNLPKKNGKEVLMEIKTDKKLKTIPVVILTTSRSEEDILKSYELYANCYINKPLDLKQFFEVVKKIKHFWMSIVVLPHKENSK